MRFAACLILGLWAIPSPSPAMDLDIAVPAGSALEWIDGIPRDVPVGYHSTESGGKKDKGEGTKIIAPRPKRPEATSIFSYVRVITWDLPIHLDWWAKIPSEPDEKQIKTGGGVKITIPYPPQIPPDLFWLASSVFLRKMMHPGEMNDSEAIQYLIYLGHPALAGAHAAGRQPGAENIAGAVKSAVKPIPRRPPSFVEGRDEYQNMMIRLTFEDLVVDFPLGLEQKFGSRIGRLQNEAIPYVIKGTEHSHLFLKRNAVYQLGKYRSDEATKALRRILLDKKQRDPVVRNRALDALAKRGDIEIVPHLIKLAKSGDKSLRVYAVYALGLIRSSKALPLLHGLAKTHQGGSGSFDILSSTLLALGRMQCGGDPKVIKTVETIYNTKMQIPNPPAGLEADGKDWPNTRGETIEQLALLALANSDTSKWADKVYEMLDKSKARDEPPAPGPGGRAIRRSRGRAGVLKAIHPMTVNFLIDVLPRLQRGDEYLKDIVKSRSTAETVRAYALYKLATVRFDETMAEFVEPLLDPEKIPGSVAEMALHALLRADKAKAIEAATGIVDQFLASKQPPPDGRVPNYKNMRRIVNGKEIPPPKTGWVPPQRHLVTQCVKLLGSLESVDAGRLNQIIDREMERRKALEAALKEDAKKNKPDPRDPKYKGKRGKDAPDPQEGLWQIEVSAPDKLLEAAIIELGHLRNSSQTEKLVGMLTDEEGQAKAEICVALGLIGDADAVDGLVLGLEQPDGWVRFIAYRELKEVSGLDIFCDWIYQPKEKRDPKVEEWKAWAKQYRGG